MDFENKEKLTGLYLFESSHDPEKLTTLKDYLARMKTDQGAIDFLTGPSRRAVENSPHLEAFRDKGYEVLFLVDPVDEILAQWLPEFEGKKLKSVGKGVADLGEEKELKEKEREFSKLTSALLKKLEDRLKEVRLSSRLTSSPACLVVAEGEASPHLDRMLKQVKGETTQQKRIMELNPNHEIIIKMRDRIDDSMLDDFAELLYGYALLAEGSELENPTKFNQAVIRILRKAI